MSGKRIVSAVAFKGLALGVSFVNVIFAAAALNPEDSLLYLTMLSVIQLMIPFAGLGVAQRMIRATPEDTRDWNVRWWFYASAAIGFAVLLAQALTSNADARWLLLPIVSVMLVHLIHAEWLRAAHARQRGFFVYNLSLLVIAGILVFFRDVTLWMLVPSLAALIWFLISERRVFVSQSTEAVHPKATDVRTAFRVSTINQFYNLIVVLLSLLSAPALSLTLVLVWRFNMFLNWQTFYWLRFGHKDTVKGATPERIKENYRVIRLNWLACAVIVIISATLIGTDWIDKLDGTSFDRSFFEMIAIYAVIRTAINLIFPHEVFSIYNATPKGDASFFVLAIASFALISAVALFSGNDLFVLIIVEICALTWRLYTKSPR